MQLVNNSNYEVGGINLNTIAEQYGMPVYVYDGNKMEAQYHKMMNAFSNTKVHIHFACKALNNINILKLFKKLGAGIDAVSIQEVWLAKQAGVDVKDILYTPNGVSMEEIDMAVKEGVMINIDNLSILEQFGMKYGSSYPVCVRINPHIMAGGNNNISVGHIDSKFGISIHQVPHILRIVNHYNMHVNGLHMHTGSDILDTDVFLRGAEILFETAQHFKELHYLDFGSGFKVKYKEGDIETDIDDLGEKLSKRFNEFCKNYGKELTLIFEPGKFLVSEAGYFLVKVNVVKQTTSAVFVGVDSGFNHLIRPMLYNAHHDVVNITYPQGKLRMYTVVGYICETDTFGWNLKIHEVNEGDVLCFKNAGAYCFTMASNYNSRFRPAEVLIYNGTSHLIRQRENMDDITRNMVDIMQA